MQSERPEYPETRSARRKAVIYFILAMLSPFLADAVSHPEAGPYLFAFFGIAAAVYAITIETDRLHRRLDAMRDGD